MASHWLSYNSRSLVGLLPGKEVSLSSSFWDNKVESTCTIPAFLLGLGLTRSTRVVRAPPAASNSIPNTFSVINLHNIYQLMFTYFNIKYRVLYLNMDIMLYYCNGLFVTNLPKGIITP